ncbi:MAG: hypothetical protein D6820_15620 [Lentisphaerae bacterium]|nr:MAG: hypothetical protein D6820_15620 [Lentisphaerota bacterium]
MSPAELKAEAYFQRLPEADRWGTLKGQLRTCAKDQEGKDASQSRDDKLAIFTLVATQFQKDFDSDLNRFEKYRNKPEKAKKDRACQRVLAMQQIARELAEDPAFFSMFEAPNNKDKLKHAVSELAKKLGVSLSWK